MHKAATDLSTLKTPITQQSIQLLKTFSCISPLCHLAHCPTAQLHPTPTEDTTEIALPAEKRPSSRHTYKPVNCHKIRALDSSWNLEEGQTMALWFLRCPQPRLRRGAPVQFAVSETWQHNRGGLARCQISGKKGKRVPRHSHRVHGGQSWKLPSLFSLRPRGFEDVVAPAGHLGDITGNIHHFASRC